MTVTTFDIASGNDDATAEYAHTAWPPSAGTFTDRDWYGVCFPKKQFLTGTYYANVALFRWDTSSIPDTDTITAAIFSIYSTNTPVNADSRTLLGDYYDFGGTPSVAADWIETIGSSIWTPVSISSLTSGVRANFSLTDLSGINKTGFTGIRMGVSGGSPSGQNEINVREFTGAHPTEYARLEVTHSAVTLDSCLPDADVTTTGWSTAPLFSKVNDASDATVIQATAV